MITILSVAGALAALAWVAIYKYQPKTNTVYTSKNTILNQMNELRPLPMGQKEFVEFCDRIISGALVPTEDKESLIGVLSMFIMELGPTESHKPDAWFIHKLRKAAANEVAQANFRTIKQRKEEKAKTAEPVGPHNAFIEANQRNKEKLTPVK